MKRAVALFALCMGTPAMAITGELGTLPTGRYICELPADGSGPPSLQVPHANFTILRASRYRGDEGTGIYLLTGDLLVMTTGPRQGERYARKTSGFLRMLDAQGNESRLRCVRRTRNNR